MVASNWTLFFLIVLAFFDNGYGAPLNFANLFAQFENPNEERDLFKRQVQPAPISNQVSLHGLIKNLEQSLVASAISVKDVANNDDAIIEEVTPDTTANDHTVTKRHTEQQQQQTNSDAKTATDTPTAAPTASTTDEKSRGVILLTTERVPAKNGSPQHIVIDRVSIQPHNGGFPLLPGFQVHHTKVVSAVVKEPTTTTNDADKQTQISITKTVIKTIGTTSQQTTQHAKDDTTITTTTKATATAVTNEKSTAATNDAHELQNKEHDEQKNVAKETQDKTTKTTEATTTKTTSKTTTTTTAAAETTTTTTTKAPINELKEAEKELKEKVAEIEADPVILSARV